MRTAMLTSLFAMLGHIAIAQLNVIPNIGVEDFRTGIKHNGLSPAGQICIAPSAQAALKLEYLFKKQHGPWIAAATSRSVVAYSFANPGSGTNVFKTDAGNTLLRLEGGYQVKTKRLFFNARPGKANAASTALKGNASSYSVHCQRSIVQSRCGSKTTQDKSAATVPSGAWIRLAPSAGLAYIPDAPTSALISKTSGTQTTYTYRAGNWRTAALAGLGFEFGKNNRQIMSLSVNYLTAFGEGLEAKQITTVEGNKTTSTTLDSKASAWNVRLGIPISLTKRKAAQAKVVEKVYIREVKKCGETKMQYKPRCYKTYLEQ